MLLLKDNSKEEIHFYILIILIAGIVSIIGSIISAIGIHFAFKTAKKENKKDESVE